MVQNVLNKIIILNLKRKHLKIILCMKIIYMYQYSILQQ